MIKFCSKYVFQYKIEYGIYFLLGIILCGLNTFIPAAMGQFINMFNVETTYSAMLKFIFLLLLTVIIGYLQLIRLEKNVNEPVNSYIEHIEKKADYLKKLVDDLYLLFWSEAIESEVDMKSVNITEVVTSLLKEYIQNSKRASEQLDIRLPHGNIWILAQEKILIRILCNLIDNALKYSTGDIMFYMWGESEYCHIQISNPSDYISDEELKSIFDLFYTKDEARIKSSGIGLYATRKLVIQISGDIQVNYEAGIFTVSIKLPLI